MEHKGTLNGRNKGDTSGQTRGHTGTNKGTKDRFFETNVFAGAARLRSAMRNLNGESEIGRRQSILRRYKEPTGIKWPKAT